MSTVNTFLVALLLLSLAAIAILHRAKTVHSPMTTLGVVLGLVLGVSATSLIATWMP